MKIPKKVKIGGHVYKIVFEKETETSNSSCGKINRKRGVIAIGVDLIKSEREATFFHEVLHSINSELKETTIDFLAQAIYAFLKDNKLLKEE